MRYLRLLALPFILTWMFFDQWTKTEADRFDDEQRENDNGYLWG
jgi:hypothetical protein